MRCRLPWTLSFSSLAVAGLLCGGVMASAQATEDPRLRFREESSVSWVLAPVVVRDASGQASSKRARKLRWEDFRLTVDGWPVPIMSFESGPGTPVRLIYLQDLSGSMDNGGKLEGSRAALRCFLEDSRPGDQFALVSFASGQTTFDVPFTAETSRLEAALEDWRGHGTTALHDAVARLPELGAEDGGLRQAAVLVTDGGDNASTLEPAEVRRILRAAELPVYVLDLGSLPTPGAPADPEAFAHVLRLLASATGGRYRMALSKDSRSGDMNQQDRLLSGMTSACRAISEDLRHQYVLGFQTRDTGTPTYRRIEVEIPKKKRFKLSHRQGYLGGPPAGDPP